MLTIIFSWVVLFILIFLVGRLFINKVEWYEYFWTGLVVVFAILQIWSIFLPVNIYSLLFVTILASVSAVLLFKKGIKIPKINLKFVFWTALILFVISYFASLSGGWPDTYGYHLNAVKWSNLYKIVPGLANLHSRLGFNSSFFLFASMIDNLFLKDRSSHVALSLMASVLSIEFFWLFIKSKNNYLKIFILFTLPIFIKGIVHNVEVSSLSTDFALLMITLAICIELIIGNARSLIIAVILSLVLLTVKQSGALFSLTIVALVSIKLILSKTKQVKTFILFILVGLLLVAPYFVRNVILSGWPLYPLPILGIDFPWSVSHDKVVELFEVIKTWAIFPGASREIVSKMSFLQWFPGWVKRNSGNIEPKMFFVSLVFLMGSVFYKYINIQILRKNIGMTICGMASLAGIFYLIFTAPDLRFGGVYFWIFFASVGSFYFAGLENRNRYMAKLLTVCSIFLTLLVSWPPRIDSGIILKSIRWDPSFAYEQVLITPNDGSPSFKVYIPGTNDSCGNSDLPCTPYPFNNFKEITPGDLSKGFAPVN